MGGSCKGGVGHAGVGWVIQGCMGHVGWGGSCRGWVCYLGVGCIIQGWCGLKIFTE